MLLRQLLLQTRMLIEHGLHVTRPSAVQALPERTLQMARLEDRILFSASPIAPIVAELADAGSSLTSALFESAEVQNGGLFAIPDQQFLDLVADSLLPAASESQNKSEAAASDEHTLELVFLDSSISNLDQMMADLRAESANDSSRTLEFVTLDSTKDGIAQITSALLQYNVVDGIHIVSHGGTGQVQLGSTWLSINNLDTYRNAISAWQYSMSDKADILFYGCNLAGSEDGQQLLQEMSLLTDCDVAASENATGGVIRNADWDLEYQIGTITADVAFSSEFQVNAQDDDSLQETPDANDSSLQASLVQAGVANVDDQAALTRQFVQSSPQREVVFVDTATQDYQQFIDDLLANQDGSRQIDVFLLDGSTDGLHQISEVLAQYNDLDAIHFVSHGVEGSVKLGGTWLTSDVLTREAMQIANWGNALSADGDLLFYGCDFASNSEGQLLVGTLSSLSGADVAASIDATGSILIGGNWTLEYAVGAIESQIAFSLDVQQNWTHVLANETVRDNFSTASYSNNDGTQSWSTSWIETDPTGGGASSGDFSATGGTLTINPSSSSGNIYRELNLTSTLSATVSFNYDNKLGGSGLVYFQVSSNGGGSYTTLSTYDTSTRKDMGSDSIDISAYLAVNTRVRFLIAGATTGSNSLTIDNVQIAYVTNTAPVLDASKSPALTAVLEDAGAPSGAVGTLVSSLVDFASPSGQVDNVTDPAPGAQLGIAVTATNATNGNWFYTTNNGTNWYSMGSVTNASARLLAADVNTRLYFQANADWNGSISDAVTFRAWDRTDNLTNGSLASTSTNGGITAFSTATDTAALTVTAVNDAPVLDNSGAMTLTTITEDQTSNSGNTVASIISSAGGDRITDVDAGAVEGIAITTLTSGNGSWEYSTNAGSSWTAVGAVANNSALLLRSTDLVRFVPNAQNATTGDITFRAWDQTTGTFGTKVDVSTNGTTTAFSTATELASITVTAVNDAPTITNAYAYTLTGTNENTTSSGALASTILTASSLGDVDTGAASGLAITSTTGNGTWQYSTDGTTWRNFGTVSVTNALLVTSTSQVHYIPDNNNGETGTFAYRTWDQTTGTASTNAIANYGDSSTNGTTTAYSTSVATASMTVTSVNDAPVLDHAGNMTFTTRTEDETTNSGDTVANIILSAGGDRITDVDTSAVEGIAITATTNGNGTWEYSTNGGSTWTAVGTISNTSALLLRATDSLRFVPNGQNATTGDVTFRAWDQSSGAFGTKVDVSINGTTTAFSTATEVASISVTAVNDAPVLDNTGSMGLGTISENNTTSTDVVSIIVGAGGDRITDVDSGAIEGIAINSVNTGNGTWRYSTDGGSTWFVFGIVSDSSALLLRATDRISYTGDSLNGGTADFTFRAWDQTSGTVGTKVDASTNGGTTAFSTATEQATVTTTSVNDAPTITNAYSYTLTGTNENTTSSGTLASTILTASSRADVDTGAVSGLAITSTTGNGTWQYSTDGTTWHNFGAVSGANALLVTSTSQVRYIPDNNNGETGTFAFRAWDQTSGSASTNATATYGDSSTSGTTTAYSSEQATASITITAVNDAPTITNGNMYSFTSTNEDTNSVAVSASTILTNASQADVDTGAFAGMAITGTTGTGTWQYSTDGTTWQTVGGVSATNALLVTSTTQMRYVPDGQNGTPGTFTYRAWDRTTGTASINGTASYSDTSTNGTATAYSISVATASISVTSVNDAPVLDNSGNMTLTTITEDQTTNSDNTVANIILSAGGDRITDVDTSAVEGIAITATTNGDGAWEYSTDGGTTWTAVGTVSNTSALLLRATDSLRFVPNGQNATTGDVTFRAWDQTTGTFGNKVDVSTNGTTTAFSTATEVASITITAINDAPVIIDTVLSITVAEDAGVPSGIVGSLISMLSGGVSDVDSGAIKGIVITASVETNGTWYYTTNNGTTWTVVGTVSSASSLLLADNANTRLYFAPGSNYNGTLASALTFRGWDQTNGSAGTKVSTSSNGGVFAFSSATDVVDVAVTAVNDEQVIATNTGLTIAENATGTVISNTMLLSSDVDNTTSQLVYTVSSVTANGTLRRSGTELALNSTFTQADINSGILTYDHNGSETTSDSFSFSVDDGAGTASTGTFNFAITPANDNTPVITSNGAGATASISIAENTTAVTTVTATDGDLPAQTLTYTIVGGADSALFVINTSTGVLAFVSGRNREANTDVNLDGIYDVTVEASDGTLTDTQSISVTITDVDEFDVGAVSDTNAAANSVAENAANGTVVGITASASDADATTNAISYSLFNSDSGRFAINSSTGVVTVAGAIDREADGASRNITIRATSADGSFTDQAFTINITDVDEFDVGTVTDSNAGANSVAENASNGTVVGITASASDVDATTNAITYSLFNSDGGRFAINSGTGVVTVAGAIDREADGASRNITIRATSADDSFTDQVFTIDITDIDESDVAAVSDINAASNAVAENAANGTAVGISAFASDADATTNAITYTLDVNAAGRFAINSSTGVVTVADGTLLNYEAATSHGITVRATSTDGLFSTQAYTINLTDVNEGVAGAVTDSNVVANAVNENSANGTTVGITGVADDPDGSDMVTYSLDSDAGGRFAINSTTGVVTVNGAIDREAAASYNITIRATSSDTSFSTQTFTINIDDVDEFDTGAVTDSNAAANSVAENASNGTVVGITASASDADATTNAITYSLFNSDGGRFTINNSTGVVTVAGAIDREVDGASRNITIRATSADGSFTDQVFAINITDVDEFDVTAPIDSNATANNVNENVAIGTAVGITASGSDADATINGVTYSLVDSDGGNFAIDPTTGIVTTAKAIDREALGASRTITVRATSTDGSAADTVFTIAINDLDEFDVGSLTDSNATANTIAENSDNGTLVNITGLASDADATTNTMTYSLDDNAGGRFAINSSTGVVTVLGGSLLNYEATTSHGITIRAASADTSFSTQNFTINLTDVNEGVVGAVSDSNAAANYVLENASNETTVGITGLATDPDGTDVVTYSLDSDAGGRFTINSITGVVTVNGAIDREAAASYDITIRATSTDTSFSTQIFTINIGDVNEFATSAVSDSNATANSVVENAASGTVVNITGLASDADATTNAITYSLFDNNGGRFAINSSSGVVTVAGAINREADGASRNITIRAVSADGSYSDQTFSISIVDANEFSVTAPIDSNASANAVNENATIGTVVGITANATDSDATTNALTYSLFDNDSGNFTIDATTGVVSTAAALNRETPGATRNITVRATSADGSTADTGFTIAINDVNEFAVTTPADVNAASNTVAENASIGAVVGITANATDADATTNTITYTMDNSAGGLFAINGSTGVVTVAAALDYETATSHSITVRATSADGSFATQTFSIAVTDVNESGVSAISDTNATTDFVAENSANGTVVGITAFATDADGTDIVSYSLDVNAGGRFAIDSVTGVVTVAGAINCEAAGTYNITIRATSADGSLSSQTFAIAIVDINEFGVTAPTDSNAAGNAVDENVAIGTVVGIMANATDADATTNTITYSLFNNDGGNFNIDTNTGVVTTAAALNRETLGASRSITVRATSADGSTADSVFTININDINEFNVGSVTDSNATANTIAENSANGTVVNITGLASDADATTDTITYSLDDNAGGRFTINSSTGFVTVLDGSLLNFEAATSHNITIRATSADTSFSTQSFTINLTDVNEAAVGAVSDSNAANNYVLENASNGTTVGIIGLATDPDGTDVVTYTLDGDSGGRFTINSITGVVTVNGAIDREAAASYNITVRVTSTDSSFSTQIFTVNIGDINEFATSPVTDADATPNSVVENAANGTVVNITGLASDADATTNTITYSLFDNDGGRFAINGSTGVVTVAGAINREADGASRNITIRATSAAGSYSDQTFFIAIVDANEFSVTAPADTDATANAVNENVAIGTVVGITASSSDSDATTNTVTYSLFNDDGGNFTIDTNTGVVTTAAALNRETSGASRSITVRATSTDGSTADTGFTIAINDVNEFAVTIPTDLNVASNTVAESAAIGAIVGITANATDADATTNTITYTLDDSVGGLFAVDGSTGVVTVAAGLDYETATSHSITVRATSADGSIATQTFNIAVTDVNESGVSAIADSNAAANAVSENALNGTTVGVIASAFDGDATLNGITYSLLNNAGGCFAIDAMTGIVTVANSSLLDREAAAAHTILIQAVSDDGSFSTMSVDIALIDVDEFDIMPAVDINATANLVAELSAQGTLTGITVYASDSDATTNAITYTLDDNAGGKFQINAATGVVTVGATALDYEFATSYSIIVRATSADSSATMLMLTINLTDVNEFSTTAIVDNKTALNEVAENVANGTIVGITALASDGDGTDAISYSLDNNAGGRFAIDSLTGVVTVADGTLLNREAAASHNVVIRATSTDGSTSVRTFTIALADQNEAPVLANTPPLSVNENTSPGTLVGTVVATDVDTGEVLTYSIVSGDTGTAFTIDARNGQITVLNLSVLNYEAVTSFQLNVMVTDAGGLSDSQTIVIHLNDLNESVTDILIGGGSVAENSAAGTFVGQLTATDPDAGESFTYNLLNDAGGRFVIDASSGRITVVAGAMLNFETASSHVVTAMATDLAGHGFAKSFIISLIDVNGAPVAVNDSLIVTQMKSLTTLPGALLGNDFDEDDNALEAVLVSGTAHGTLILNSDGTLNYTPEMTFSGIDSFSYQVTDGTLWSNLAVVFIEVTPLVGPGGNGGSGSGSGSGSGNGSLTDSSGESSVSGDSSNSSDTTNTTDTTTNTGTTDNTTTTATRNSGRSDNSTLVTMAGTGVTAAAASAASEASEDGESAFAAFKIVVLPGDGPLIQTSSDSLSIGHNDVNSIVGATQSLWSMDSGMVMASEAFVPNIQFTISAQDAAAEEESYIVVLPSMEKIVIGSSAVVSTSLSVGYVIWVLRGGSLLTAFLSAMPAWQAFDPLPVLQSFEKKNEEEDDTLLSIVTRRTKNSPRPVKP